MSDLLTIQLRLKKWSKIFLDQNYEHLFYKGNVIKIYKCMLDQHLQHYVIL